MRNLEEKKRNGVFEAIKTAIQKMGYGLNSSLVTVKMITGRDEGAFLWLSTNYLLGKFNPKVKKTVRSSEFDEGSVILSGSSAIFANEMDGFLCIGNITGDQRYCRQMTYGVLDMGGASLQIAYEFNSPNLVSAHLFCV